MTRRRRPRHGDGGSSLVIVLILITVISVVMGVILSQDDTALRSTDALRDQAADVYSADGATQAILNGLAKSGINCNNPTSTTGVPLGTTANPFYQPGSGRQGAINAYAQCTPDPVIGATTSASTPPPSTTVSTVTPAPVTSTGTYLGAGDPSLPSYALLTTGTAAADLGFDLHLSANNKTVCVENGSVASNSGVNASGELLSVRINTTGAPCDTSGTGVAADGSKLVLSATQSCIGGSAAFRPTPCTVGPSVPTPAAPPLPTSVGPTNPAPKCTPDKSYAAFVPGYYTDSSLFNNPCGTRQNVFEWLSPGNYFLNFTGTTVWTWPTRLVAGTPITASGAAVSGLNPTDASTLSALSQTAAAPNACADPAGGGAVSGAQLIFAGASSVSAPLGSSAELCATSSTTSPPVAMYGLPTTTTVGGTSVPGETLCSPTACNGTTLIDTVASNSSAQAQIYVKGYVYAPNAQLIMTVKNSIGQLFNWGLVIRGFQLTVNGSTPLQALIKLPKPNTGVGVTVTTSTPPPYPTTSVTQPPPTMIPHYTIRYVNVWTCTVASLQASGQSTCPSSGTANVQVRVLFDPANPTSTLRVLSWNSVH